MDKSEDEGEGRDPDDIVEIHVTKEEEQAVQKWWTGVLANLKEKYNLRTNNCSTIVYRALREAGCFKAKNEPIISPWTPNMVLIYAKQCQKDKKDIIEIAEKLAEDYLQDLEKWILTSPQLN
ncbi:hypothetical protein FSP39_015582 [Pinctada imbricata]|uniref:Uncharacterized protein n=1 Tax=Pinctada imbricata TaxID=66713 RepID=A0AA88YTL4_PINIB|nr:hypothetical protein FSP39_015582 [Pinctada imbricata]